MAETFSHSADKAGLPYTAYPSEGIFLDKSKRVKAYVYVKDLGRKDRKTRVYGPYIVSLQGSLRLGLYWEGNYLRR